jgi:carbon starvation protein CstA
LLVACGGISGFAASIAPSVGHAVSINELSALEWRNVRYWHLADIAV